MCHSNDQSASSVAPEGGTARGRHLAQQLTRHRPRDAEEAAHLAQMQALLASEGDPFTRDHMQPGHFTSSAFVLSPDGRKLLLIFHSKLRRWLQPGGHVEPGDASLLEAARREVREEVGLDEVEAVEEAPFDLDVHVIPARKTEPDHRHFDVRFLLRAPTLVVRAGSDAHDARWIALEEVAEVESDRSVMRAVEKLRCR